MIRTTPLRTHTPETIRLGDGREVAVPHEMTPSAFEAFPWPEGQRWELIWGTPVLTPSPQPSHQDAVGRLYRLLADLFETDTSHVVFFGLDVALPGSESYLCPDVSVFADDGSTSFEARPIRAVPKLVLEGLSPSTRGNDQGAKLEAFAAAGVPEYWIVNPANGSLSILIEPRGLLYTEVTAVDGFVASPLLGIRLRLIRKGVRFAVETLPDGA